MRYELWDGETGNRVGEYPTRQAALQAVAEDARAYGPDSGALVRLGLLERQDQRAAVVAEGSALVAMALREQVEERAAAKHSTGLR